MAVSYPASWLPVAADSDFPLFNLPLGIFSTPLKSQRVGSIIGETVIDLAALAELGFLSSTGIQASIFHQPSLNWLIRLGKEDNRRLREVLIDLFSIDNSRLRDDAASHEKCLHPVSEVTLHLPIEIGDYTDFYSSREHATNVGMMFRDPANALLPNWLHLPVGYHGRSSSIVVSDTPIRRPLGQVIGKDGDMPTLKASQQLDFELEMAFVIGKENPMGERIGIDQAEDHIFGMMLFNDWSARDIQRWEYVPLGPFLGKNFASSVSPWVVSLDALAPFRCQTPTQDPAPLPYLQGKGEQGFDIGLEILLQPANGQPEVISRNNFKLMYWSMAQQLAHHTIGGCPMRIGDLCASGTISGSTPDSLGSMLELAWKGTRPLTLADGSTRSFLADGDTVIMRGFAQRDGLRIGFGEVSGKVMPALMD